MSWEFGRMAYPLTFDWNPKRDYLRIMVEHDTHYHGRQRYAIDYEPTDSAVGGERCFWLCPNRRCWRRTTVLYRPIGGAYFLCRQCWGLAYRTQTESKSDRYWRQYLALIEELENPRIRLPRLLEIRRTLQPAFLRAAGPGDAFLARCESQFESRPSVSVRRGPGRPSKAGRRAIEKSAREFEASRRPKRPLGRPKTKRAYVRVKPIVLSERTSEMQAWCPRCRDRRDLENPKSVTFRNGRPAMQGNCSTCGTKTARIISQEAALATERDRVKPPEPETMLIGPSRPLFIRAVWAPNTSSTLRTCG
jgi:Domain of unknown function (DUF5679)